MHINGHRISCTRRHRSVSILLSSAFTLVILFSNTASCEELEMVNRPVNSSGLTGLLFTTSPFTIPSRSIEFSAAALSEKSTVPDYSISELPSVSVTVGIAPGMELALKGSYLHKTSEGGTKERGAGDTELAYKWNFLPQTESSSLPSLAMIVTGIAPVHSSEVNVSGIAHWGARFGLSAGREIEWGDHIIGMYGDANIVVHDLSDEQFRDRYTILNAGLLFPVSKYRNLQMLLEYAMVNGIDKRSAVGGDHSAITYGLRLVNERFNLSIGTQFVHKPVQGFENSSRIIGMMSIKLL